MKWWYENEEEMKSCEHCSHEDCKNIGGTWYCLDCPECGVNWEKKMEFDKGRIYSAVNADELRAGDKVIVANTMANLREDVRKGVNIDMLREVHGEDCLSRFIVKEGWYALAYLVERKENCTNCDCCVCAERNWASDLGNERIYCCPKYKPKTETPDLISLGNGQYVERKHYRPFKDTDELIKTWIAKRMITYPDLCLPHIWVRYKMNQCGQIGILITKFEKNYVQIEGDMIAMHALMADYEFLDGSPCGVEE